MKPKLLSLLLLLALVPGAFSSCDDDPWEEEMMGEYWDTQSDSYFVLRTDKTGFIEYANGDILEFGWYASENYIYFMIPPYGLDFETYKCKYRWTREGYLHIMDFIDGGGDLWLSSTRFYR